MWWKLLQVEFLQHFSIGAVWQKKGNKNRCQNAFRGSAISFHYPNSGDAKRIIRAIEDAAGKFVPTCSTEALQAFFCPGRLTFQYFFRNRRLEATICDLKTCWLFLNFSMFSGNWMGKTPLYPISLFHSSDQAFGRWCVEATPALIATQLLSVKFVSENVRRRVTLWKLH